jgi:hypothetical protein
VLLLTVTGGVASGLPLALVASLYGINIFININNI